MANLLIILEVMNTTVNFESWDKLVIHDMNGFSCCIVLKYALYILPTAKIGQIC